MKKSQGMSHRGALGQRWLDFGMQATPSLKDTYRPCVPSSNSRGFSLCLKAFSTKTSQTECTQCGQSTQRRQLLLTSLILPVVELCPWPASAKVAGMHHLTAVHLPCCHQQAIISCLQEDGSDTSSKRPRGFSRYVKKRKLDPLDSYIPALLQARLQLETAGKVMGG